MSRFHLIGMMFLSILAASAAQSSQRNVLLIIGDDHGLEASCYGHPSIKTPNLDRLASRGTRFANAFATVASCSPSRSVLLTGMYSHANGQYGLAHAAHNQTTKPEVRSLPAILNDSGYRTAIIGKNHVRPESVYPYQQTLKSSQGNRSVAEMAKVAGEFFAASDEPFFLLVGFSDPHRAGGTSFANQAYPGVEQRKYKPAEVTVPAYLPDEPAVRADLAEYYESVDRLDQGVGFVLEALRKSGKHENTLVIYVSDNGIPFPRAKTTLYDAGIHLPLIVQAPGRKQGIVSEAMVSFIDVAPTVLEFAGIEPPKRMQGRSLLPILEQGNADGWDEVYGSHLFHEITNYYPMRAIRTRQHKLIWNIAHELAFPLAGDIARSPSWQAMREAESGRAAELREQHLHRPEFELYDIENDPHEMKNLAEDPAHAKTLERLRARLMKRLRQTDDPFAPREAAR